MERPRALSDSGGPLVKKFVATVSGVAAVIGFGVAICPPSKAAPFVPCPYDASAGPQAQKQYFDSKTAQLVAMQNDVNTRILGPLSNDQRDAWAKSPAGLAALAQMTKIEQERDNLPQSCLPSQPVSSAPGVNPGPRQPAPANSACPYDMNTQAGRDAFQQAVVASSRQVGQDQQAYGPNGNAGLATNDINNERSTSNMILACQGINAPPQPTGPQPDPNRLVPPPGGFQTPAQMTKADCAKLENDLHDKRTSFGLDLAGIAADVPVGMAVAAALGICAINGVNDLPDDVNAAMDGLMGTAAKAAGG
jgi:hypothetical protein